MEQIQEKLRKIAAMAESGVAGERENAQRLLDELCARHGVSQESLLAEEKRWFAFRFADDLEKDLLGNVVSFVARTTKIRNSPPRDRREKSWDFELNQAQALEVKECFEHFRKAWKQHQRDALTVFVNANRIFGPKEDDAGEGRELTPEELARIRRLANQVLMTPATPWKPNLKLTI